MPSSKDLAEHIRSEWQRMWKGRRAVSWQYAPAPPLRTFPRPSFAGQQDTYLNVGEAGGPLGQDQEVLVLAVHSPGDIVSGDQGLRAFQGQVGRRGAEDGGTQTSLASCSRWTRTRRCPTSSSRPVMAWARRSSAGRSPPTPMWSTSSITRSSTRSIAKQTWKLVRGKTGDTVKENIPERHPVRQKMTDEQILALGEDRQRHRGALQQAHGHRVVL